MEPALGLEARRLFVSAALTTHARRSLRGRVADDSDAADLIALARLLGEGAEIVRRRHHLRFDPPYPGVTAGPEVVRGGSRLVLACAVFDHEKEPLGIAFTTLIPGRPAQISLAPMEAGVPGGWHPVADPP
jgi:hypothetical protein